MYDALIKLNSIKDLYSFVDILDKHSGTFEIVANDSDILSQLQPFILHE